MVGWFASGAALTLLAACRDVPAAPPAPAATQAPPLQPTTKPAVVATPAPPTPVPAASVATPAAATKSSPATPRTGGTLRWAIASDIANLDGHQLTSTHYETVFRAHDRLISLDAQGNPLPQLAESWEFGNNGTQLKLNLRRGVQFHTGREFSSDDVKWNILRVRDPKVASGSFVGQSNWFTNIETPDRYTVISTFDSPRPVVFDMFQLLNMLDPVTMQGPEAATKTVGTGPFVLVEWAQGDHITFKKNPNYWLSGRPYLDGIETPIIRDPQAMMVQLETGAIDVADQPPIREFTRLKSDPDYQALTNPNDGQHVILSPNTTVAPFDNKKVRQALRFAIDRKRMNELALLGIGQPKALPWLPGSPAYEEDKSNAPFDLDRAAALLAEAGVSALEMDILPLVIYSEIDTYVQIYQADLAKIGIKANIVRLDFAQWLDQVNNSKFNGMYASSDGRAQLNPLTYLTASPAANPYKNNAGFKSQDLERLIEQLGKEVDPARQKALLSQINDLYLDESYTNVVASFPVKLVARKNVRGVEFPLYAAFSVTNAWLDA